MITCPTCQKELKTVKFNSGGTNYYCPKCMIIWGDKEHLEDIKGGKYEV
jgi:Zn-finger nucleic acid-binding protein